MKLVVCIVALAVSVSAQRRVPQTYTPGQVIPIVSYVNENNYDGTYRYSYETGNGITAQEQGFLKNPGQKDLEAQSAQGSYSYTAPDGTPITVTWYADETGFHAEGAHLPTPPPIPDAIAKSLQQIQQQRPAAGNQYFQGK
uniref:Endocuticle structural glycoprotein SgAbd-2 n=1 Tax=Clastoptera arizonana TaxID=38151 RepID=A0A1B6CC76_9HEMI